MVAPQLTPKQTAALKTLRTHGSLYRSQGLDRTWESLISRGLVESLGEGRGAVSLKLTPVGRTVLDNLERYQRRAGAVRRNRLESPFVASSEPEPEPVGEVLARIALKELRFETLETRNSDGLDFREVFVANVKAALLAAFEAGKRARPGAELELARAARELVGERGRLVGPRVNRSLGLGTEIEAHFPEAKVDAFNSALLAVDLAKGT